MIRWRQFIRRAGLPSRGAALAVIGVLSACAPSSKAPAPTGAIAHIQIRRDRLQQDYQSSALSDGTNTVTLPPDLCYVIHVTGTGLEQVSASDLTCGPEHGLGQMSPKAYNVGDEAVLDLKIGTTRHFELIGFQSPLGSINGRGVCGDLVTDFVKADTVRETHIRLRVNGSEVTSKPILFASGDAEIKSGDNLIVLQAIPKVTTALTTQLAFGAPYNRSDLPKPPAVCVPPPPPRGPTHAYAISSVGGSSPVTGSSGQRKLFMTVTPEVFARQSNGQILPGFVAGASGQTQLATGLAEINERRER